MAGEAIFGVGGEGLEDLGLLNKDSFFQQRQTLETVGAPRTNI